MDRLRLVPALVLAVIVAAGACTADRAGDGAVGGAAGTRCTTSNKAPRTPRSPTVADALGVPWPTGAPTGLPVDDEASVVTRGCSGGAQMTVRAMADRPSSYSPPVTAPGPGAHPGCFLITATVEFPSLGAARVLNGSDPLPVVASTGGSYMRDDKTGKVLLQYPQVALVIGAVAGRAYRVTSPTGTRTAVATSSVLAIAAKMPAREDRQGGGTIVHPLTVDELDDHGAPVWSRPALTTNDDPCPPAEWVGRAATPAETAAISPVVLQVLGETPIAQVRSLVDGLDPAAENALMAAKQYGTTVSSHWSIEIRNVRMLDPDDGWVDYVVHYTAGGDPGTMNAWAAVHRTAGRWRTDRATVCAAAALANGAKC